MKKNWKRHLLVGIVVALIFFGWFLRGFLWINWRFKLFSGSAWKFLLREFRAGWMVSAISDWIFLLTICFAVPLFLYLWYLCTKVKWRALFKTLLKWIKNIIVWPFKWFFKRRAEKKLIEQEESSGFGSFVAGAAGAAVAGVAGAAIGAGVAAMRNNNSNANGRPRAMSVQHTGSFGNTRRAEPKTTFQMPGTNPSYAAGNTYPYGTAPMTRSAASAYPGTNAAPAFDMENESYASMSDVSQMPLEEIHLPERQAVVEDLDAIWAERGYQVIPNVPLTSGTLDYVAVNNNTIWACLLDKEPSDWLADEESFNGEDPLWFSEVDHRVSPIFVLQKLCNELKTKLGDKGQAFSIRPLLIEQKGNIINAEDMLKSWLEMGVAVCRTDKGGPDDLSIFGDFLKPGEAVSGEIFAGIKAVLIKGE